MRYLFPSCLLLFFAFTLRAGELTFDGTTDRAAALYSPGEKMVFNVRLLEDSKPVGGMTLKWTRTGDDGKTETGEALSSETEPLVIVASMDKPGFVRIEAWVEDDNGQALLNSESKPIRFDGGAGVEPGKLTQGIAEPADFDDFWERQRVKLAEVPLKFNLTEVPSRDPDYVTYDVKIDCAGGKPVSGYLTRPKDSGPKSLAAQMGVMGYGVASATPSYSPGTMMFNINPHGIENGKDTGFYKNLGDGELKRYAFSTAENARPETSYFGGMMLRVLRALEFLKAQPEWNGKDLICSGGSQGGLQALAGAALDKDVTKCIVYIPWCCDVGGTAVGRLKGWRPDYADGLGYYDAVNMAKRIKCQVSITAGLGDYVCPPSGAFVLYNNLGGPKQIELVQGKTHAYTPRNSQRIILSQGKEGMDERR